MNRWAILVAIAVNCNATRKTSLWILVAKGLRQHAPPMLNLGTGLGHTPTGGSQ
ncbi:MAG: hypothetical protein WAU78_11900 [Roseiarcus sp.]